MICIGFLFGHRLTGGVCRSDRRILQSFPTNPDLDLNQRIEYIKAKRLVAIQRICLQLLAHRICIRLVYGSTDRVETVNKVWYIVKSNFIERVCFFNFGFRRNTTVCFLMFTLNLGQVGRWDGCTTFIRGRVVTKVRQTRL